MGFLIDYFGITDSSNEVVVCCPFEHRTSSGVVYYETNPSAYVNTNENLFYCHACGTGMNEVQFIKHILGCSLIDAHRMQEAFNKDEYEYEWTGDPDLTLTPISKELALDKLKFTEEVIEQLHIRTTPNAGDTTELAFPVIMYGKVLDIRCYNPNVKPKCRSRRGAMTGLVYPYDLWVDDTRPTILCAGEKDMAIARSYELNAITLTGGEQSLPRFYNCFKDKEVCICYDNDETGIKGAHKIARALYGHAKIVRMVTGFHQTCTEKGEDLWDFFVKYGKTKRDLVDIIINTPPYELTEEILNKEAPLMSLLTASDPSNIGKLVRSNIQVVSVSESAYVAPAAILLKKFKLSGDEKSDTMAEGAVKEWELTDKNIGDILHLVDNNFTEEAINKNIKTLLKVNPKERCVKISKLKRATIFKAHVTDMFETTSLDAQPMEYMVYAVGCKLESGKKYTATHKLIPHPYKGQQLVMCVTNVTQASDSVSNFKLDEERKAHLKLFQDLEGTVAEKMHTLSEKVKGLLGYNGNNPLITTIDLAYHTVLSFNFGTFKNVRGYLDTLVVGESRMGKSSTADTLREAYQLGTFVSLAGNGATIPGLVGGSNKTANGFQTRAGVIPQNHKGLIIFEEFGKSQNSIITELTDIRSSNEVRITRVSGSITLPALVRMISLTNVKSINGVIKSIASYPNGISVVTELVNTAEDIARYDIILILSDKGNTQFDPFWEPAEPMPVDAYRTRVRWVWSRTPEDIIISREIGLYIMEKCNELNSKYDCHIKFFGTEAWKKVARLAISVAGYLVSTDETYTKIIVDKQHVDYAVDYFTKIYDNSTFKLKEYVDNEKRYSMYDADAIKLLQDEYTKNPGLIIQLEQTATASRQMLLASSGLANEELSRALSRLTRGLFIKFNHYDIIPTERFRGCLSQINRETEVRRAGE